MSTGALPAWCCGAAAAANVSDGAHDGARCSNSDVPGMSYNHGLLMSSAALLYNLTREAPFLHQAQAACQSVARLDVFCTSKGLALRTIHPLP